MAKIIEKIIEPSLIEVGSTFKFKIKVEDYFTEKREIIAENNYKLITESGEVLRTEWGD